MQLNDVVTVLMDGEEKPRRGRITNFPGDKVEISFSSEPRGAGLGFDVERDQLVPDGPGRWKLLTRAF